MVIPAAPTPLATPVVSPLVGGYGRALQYLSISSYEAAPTAIDVSNLGSASVDAEGFLSDTTDATQIQILDDVLRRASRWADRIVFGADPAGKDASLCLTQTVEGWYFKVKPDGTIPVVCDYKPIVELDGMEIGFDPSNLQSITADLASKISFGRRTIYVPLGHTSYPTGPQRFLGARGSGLTYVLWSYWNGYPHLALAEAAEAGDSSIVVTTNGPNNVVKGVFPNSQMRVYDMTDLSSPGVESVTIASVSGTTLNLASPLEYDHPLPSAPDFIPVTMIPDDVGQAVIFLATSLIKSRGDTSLVLDNITEPTQISSGIDSGIVSDVRAAMAMLSPFAVPSKTKN